MHLLKSIGFIAGFWIAFPWQVVAQDSLSLMHDLSYLCSTERGGRYPGTKGHTEARRYIREQFLYAGLSPHNGLWEQEFTGKNNVPLTNIFGVLEGESDSYLLVGAHYDHIGTKNNIIYAGCDDNASGVATMLHIAKSLAGKKLHHTVVFVAFDGEEIGMQGSKKWVENPVLPLEKARLVINMDMVSKSNAGELYIAGTYHYPFLLPPLEVVKSRLEYPKVLLGHDTGGAADWTYASDHAPFHRKKIPFLYFGVEDHDHYHQSTDRFENTDFSFFYQSASFILEAIYSIDRHIHEIR